MFPAASVFMEVFMNQNEFQVSVTYNGRQYLFPFGSQAYIFHTGILNGFYDNYGTDALLQYLEFVHKCYLCDDNHTPLGSLADYVAQGWETLREKSCRTVLEAFYASIF